MEVYNSFVSCFNEILGKFPGVVTFTIAFPSDTILKLSVIHLTVKDLLNGVLFFSIFYFGFGRRRMMFTVIMPGR